MFKHFIVSELTTIFGCTKETLDSITKKTSTYLGIYCAIILLLFVITLSHVYILGALAGFLLTIGIIILSTVFSFFVFLISLYYGAHFAAKGWKR